LLVTNAYRQQSRRGSTLSQVTKVPTIVKGAARTFTSTSSSSPSSSAAVAAAAAAAAASGTKLSQQFELSLCLSLLKGMLDDLWQLVDATPPVQQSLRYVHLTYSKLECICT
jgi:hypothetical protein